MTLSLLGLGHLLADVSQKFGNYEKSWDVERLQYSVRTGHGPPPPAEPSSDPLPPSEVVELSTALLLSEMLSATRESPHIKTSVKK